MENLGIMRQMEIDHEEAQPEVWREWETDPDTGEEGEVEHSPVNPDTEYNRQMSQPASVDFLRSQGR
jgi:hypothetical protein